MPVLTAVVRPGAVSSIVVADSCGLVRSNAGLSHTLNISMDKWRQQSGADGINSHPVQQPELFQDVADHAAPTRLVDMTAVDQSAPPPRAVVTNSKVRGYFVGMSYLLSVLY